jgi:hypothetical protein
MPLWQRASTEVLQIVVDAELASLLGRGLDKDRALAALAARQELAERMRSHGWLAIEAARAAGAPWAEIDTALGVAAGTARDEYESTLTGQKDLGLADRGRGDPGPPEA